MVSSDGSLRIPFRNLRRLPVGYGRFADRSDDGSIPLLRGDRSFQFRVFNSLKKRPSLPSVVGGNDFLGAPIYLYEVPPLDPPISGERV